MRRIFLPLALICAMPHILTACDEDAGTKASCRRYPAYVANQVEPATTEEVAPDMSPEAQVAQKVIRGMKRGLDMITKCGCSKPRPKEATAKCGCSRPKPKPRPKCGCSRPRPKPRPRRSEAVEEDVVEVCTACNGAILPEGVEQCAECNGTISSANEDANKSSCCCSCGSCSSSCSSSNPCCSSCCKAIACDDGACSVDEDANKCGCNRPKPRPKCGDDGSCSIDEDASKCCGRPKPKPRPKCGDDGACSID